MDAPADTHCDNLSAMPLQVPGLPTTSFIPPSRWVRASGEKRAGDRGAREIAAAASRRSGEAGHSEPDLCRSGEAGHSNPDQQDAKTGRGNMEGGRVCQDKWTLEKVYLLPKLSSQLQVTYILTRQQTPGAVWEGGFADMTSGVSAVLTQWHGGCIPDLVN